MPDSAHDAMPAPTRDECIAYLRETGTALLRAAEMLERMNEGDRRRANDATLGRALAHLRTHFHRTNKPLRASAIFQAIGLPHRYWPEVEADLRDHPNVEVRRTWLCWRDDPRPIALDATAPSPLPSTVCTSSSAARPASRSTAKP